MAIETDSLSSTDLGMILPRLGGVKLGWGNCRTLATHDVQALKSPRNRSITFDDHVHLISSNVILRQDTTWYSKSEYRRMRRETTKTLARIARGGHCCDTEEHCAHGLEGMTPRRSRQSKRWRCKSVESVLVEQDTQMDSGTYSPEALASVYIQCSNASRNEAATRGKATGTEVLKLYDSNDESRDYLKKAMPKRRRRLTPTTIFLARLQIHTGT